MPRNTREWAKREIDAAVKNIDWCGTHIYEVIKKYEADHPEVSEPLTAGLKVLEEVQTLFKQVRISF